MTRTWMKGLIAIVLASPAALAAVYEKESPARDHEVKAPDTVRVNKSDRFDVATNVEFPIDAIDLDDYEAFVNRGAGKASIAADRKSVFTPGTARRDRSPNDAGLPAWRSVHSVGCRRAH
jgi:hypothetical protein